MRTSAYQRVSERHAGSQNLDPHLTRTRAGIVLLHHFQDLRPAEVINHDTLHSWSASSRPRPTPSVRSPPEDQSQRARFMLSSSSVGLLPQLSVSAPEGLMHERPSLINRRQKSLPPMTLLPWVRKLNYVLAAWRCAGQRAPGGGKVLALAAGRPPRHYSASQPEPERR